MIAVAIAAASAWGATWTKYESDVFRVTTDAGEKAARTKMTELDQLRHTLGAYLGKESLDAVWPIEIVLFANQREYAAYALPQPLVDGPDSTLGAWSADTPLPHDLLREITRQLIEENAGRMPQWVDQALMDLMATIQVKDTKVSLGAAPSAGELPVERMRAWAKIQMLASQPEYSGKLRVYFNNLQQGGDEDSAVHNAFSITPAELNKRAATYFEAGSFAAVPIAGTPINLGRDMDEKRLADAEVKDLFAALKAAGKEFPPESPRGLLKKGTREDLEAAIKANPKWAEPHAALAERLGNPPDKAKEFKLAATLAPRNSDYWQQLALAQEDSGLYADADKSWKLAERNAAVVADRSIIHKERMALEDRRVQAEAEEKKHKATNVADDLERVKKEAEARIHAAEDAANKRNGSTPSGAKVVPWWNDEDGQKLGGSLTNVDCLKGDAVRLTFKPATGAAVKLLIPDTHNLAVKGADEIRFACGVQRPAKSMTLIHDGMPDAQQGTVGNVHTVVLP